MKRITALSRSTIVDVTVLLFHLLVCLGKFYFTFGKLIPFLGFVPSPNPGETALLCGSNKQAPLSLANQRKIGHKYRISMQVIYKDVDEAVSPSFSSALRLKKEQVMLTF